MAQFDIYKIGMVHAPYVVDVQSDFLTELNTRIVIPLVPVKKTKGPQLAKLHPVIQIEGKGYILRTAELGSVRKSRLKEPLKNIEDSHRQIIIEALDFVFLGF